METDISNDSKPRKKQLSIKLIQAAIKEINGIQVNFCKNPLCNNFNVPYTGDRKDLNYKRKGTTVAPKPSGPASDNRNISAHPSMGTAANSPPSIICQSCGEAPPLKSNHAINEVLKLWSYHPDNSACPDRNCKNHHISIGTKGAYKRNGKTGAGTVRWLCKACNRSFVDRAKIRPSREGETPWRYNDIIKGLVNHIAFKRMEEIYDVNPVSIYNYIEKAYAACLRFNVIREQRLPAILDSRGITYLATDRQELLVNWKDRKNRNAISIKAVCSIDAETRFVYRYDVGIDDLSDAETIHTASIGIGDVDKAYLLRKYPHLVIPSDMSEEKRISGYIEQELLNIKRQYTSITDVELSYLEAQMRPDIELPSSQFTLGTGLPKNCLILREDYQLYAHYIALNKLIPGNTSVINFADQESGLRAAFMSAFADKIQCNKAHLFYIKYKKGVVQDERDEAAGRTRERINGVMNHYNCDGKTAKQILCIDAITNRTVPVGKWKDLWGEHPIERMTEVGKTFSHQTYNPAQSNYEIGHYLSKASLHTVDNYFMRVRRRVSQLERGFPSASNDRRLWYGRNFYRPDMVKKASLILMTYLNYCRTKKNEKTPAEKLGIAKGDVRLRDILNS